MGNNFCYSKIEQESTISQLICLQKFNECNVYLTIGKIENEAVDCLVYENDQFQKFPVPCKFQTNDNTCNFVKSTEKNSKNYIFVLLKNQVIGDGQNHNEREKQNLYEIIQDVLKIADERQMRSIAFPVFLIKDYTTSATIMLMAIKIFIVEQICQRLTKIYIILNVSLFIKCFFFSPLNKSLVSSGYFHRSLIQESHKHCTRVKSMRIGN